MERSLKIKTICNAASAVHTCLQRSTSAELGQIGDVRTVEITGIPDGVTDTQVLRAWQQTIDITWLGNNAEYPRHTYAFAEIGNGRIIRPRGLGKLRWRASDRS